MLPSRLATALSLTVILMACGQDQGTENSSITHIKIRIATTGVSLDPDGYELHLRLSGGAVEEMRPMKINSIADFDRLPGTYTASLTDLSPNCVIAGTPERAFNAGPGIASDSTEFAISCPRADGTLSVYTKLPAEAGPGPFPITLQGLNPRPLGAVDSTRFVDLADGLYSVAIDSMKPFPSTDPCLVLTTTVQVRLSGGHADAVTFPAFKRSSACE